jgi:hypothetical protein
MSFQLEITKALNKLGDLVEKKNPDANVKNSPHGVLLAAAYFWTKVEKFAEAKKAAAWEALEDAGIGSTANKDVAGDYTVADTPSFLASYKVSEPRKKMDEGYFAEQLYKSKYKVPLPFTRELFAASKLPGKGSVTKTIIEK